MREQLYSETQTLQKYANTDFPREVFNLADDEALTHINPFGMCLQATARGYGQAITLDLRNESLEKVLKEIKNQTGYLLIYTRAQLRHALPVAIQLKNATIKDALDHCFANQPLSYTIEDKYVVVINKPERHIPKSDQTIDISGKVVNDKSRPVFRVVEKTSNSTTNNSATGKAHDMKSV